MGSVPTKSMKYLKMFTIRQQSEFDSIQKHTFSSSVRLHVAKLHIVKVHLNLVSVWSWPRMAIKLHIVALQAAAQRLLYRESLGLRDRDQPMVMMCSLLVLCRRQRQHLRRPLATAGHGTSLRRATTTDPRGAS